MKIQETTIGNDLLQSLSNSKTARNEGQASQAYNRMMAFIDFVNTTDCNTKIFDVNQEDIFIPKFFAQFTIPFRVSLDVSDYFSSNLLTFKPDVNPYKEYSAFHRDCQLLAKFLNLDKVESLGVIRANIDLQNFSKSCYFEIDVEGKKVLMCHQDVSRGTIIPVCRLDVMAQFIDPALYADLDSSIDLVARNILNAGVQQGE